MGRPRKTTSKTTNRVVIYLRVSGEEQVKHGHGLDAQLDACQTYAKTAGFTVVEVCRDEGISGTKPVSARPGLARAITLCELNQADVILIYAQDRLARAAAVFEAVRDRAIKAHFRIITARDGQDLTTEENEIPGDVQALVVSLERKMIARRLYAGRRERSKRDGLGSGFVPFGYHLQDDAIAVHPDQADTIRRLFALRDAGMTYAATAKALNDDGMTTPAGKDWTTSTVQGIERNRTLYQTGARSWGNVTAAQPWPAIL
ncbi:MAG: recombinase family protein [Anaerolineae bacterium]|jgi:DNA invertase Pin-like site-specific DNA recombinase